MHSVSKDNFCPKTESDQYTSILEFWRENFKSINQQYFTKDKFFEHKFVICHSVQ